MADTAANPDRLAPPPGYSRATYYLANQSDQPLREQDVEDFLEAQLSVSLHDRAISSGIVTDVRIVDEGRRLQLTVESSGRRCLACGHVYTTEQAATALGPRPAGDALAPFAGALYADVPRWGRVCVDPVRCWNASVNNL